MYYLVLNPGPYVVAKQSFESDCMEYFLQKKEDMDAAISKAWLAFDELYGHYALRSRIYPLSHPGTMPWYQDLDDRPVVP